MLLTRYCPTGAAKVSFQSAQRNALNDRSVEHDVAGITARICTALENSDECIISVLLSF